MPIGTTIIPPSKKVTMLARARDYLVITSAIVDILKVTLSEHGTPFTDALLHGVFVSKNRPRPWNSLNHVDDFIDIILTSTGLTCEELQGLLVAERDQWSKLSAESQTFLRRFMQNLVNTQ